MTIDEKIQAACQSIDGLTYHFNDWTRANVSMDDIQLPVLLNLLPVVGFTNIKNDRWRESRECMFAFLDKSGNDDTALENEVVVTRMRQYKRHLIKAINDSGYFKPIEGDIKDSVILDKLDVCVTGIVLPLTLTERDGECYR